MRSTNKTLALAALSALIGCSDGAKSATKIHTDASAISGAENDSGAETDSGATQIQHVDRSTATDVGTSGDLDYADGTMWLCRPDIDPNECHRDLDATEVLADGSLKTVPHEAAKDPDFDCFYVYPTVLLDGSGNMTDFSQKGVDMALDALLPQAARFTRLCEVYAPLYRQNGLSAGGSSVGLSMGANPALGLADVRAAFKYYLEHYNNGRKFVLLGHSQGSFVLTSLIQMDIDEQPDLRAQLISALLIGGSVMVPDGELVGGSFKNIPLCSKPGETGCAIAYNSFAKEAPPPSNSAFGRASNGMQVACTEPAALAGNRGKYKGSYLPLKLNNATFVPSGSFPDGIATPFALYRDVFQGSCVDANGYHYLEISLELADGDTRQPPYRSPALDSIGFGLHLVDYNLPMDDLLDAVAQQAAAAK